MCYYTLVIKNRNIAGTWQRRSSVSMYPSANNVFTVYWLKMKQFGKKLK